jgi:hypothetical protein
MTPNPGDFAVVNTGTRATPLIRVGEFLCTLLDDEPKISEWDHAVICSRVVDGTVMIVEAQPGGAVEVPWHYETRPHQWSTGILAMPAAAGGAALVYAQPGPWGPHGVPYSALDYFAMVTHELHIPAPGLREYIGSENHMICSQLVDRAALDAGRDLFPGDWPGYVKPSDLGFLLGVA